MSVPITVKRDGTRVSVLLWRAYGKPGVTAAMLRRTYDLNPGLAALGAILPIGTSLVLPDLITAKATAARVGVSLFGTS